MAIREIVVYPDERLRKPTTEVVDFNDDLRTLVADMFETMYDDNGIGLAAPQIGISKKIVVVHIEGETSDTNYGPYVFINPKIVSKEGTTTCQEGCLSVPEVYADVTRAERVVLEAQNEFGELKTYNADGLFAVCIQHELDHLDGRLFIDHLSSYKREKLLKELKKKKK